MVTEAEDLIFGASIYGSILIADAEDYYNQPSINGDIMRLEGIRKVNQMFLS